MTDNQLEKYSKMSIEDLEAVVNELNEERMDIAQAIEDKVMKEDYGKRKYAKVDKLHAELYIMFEKKMTKQYNEFLNSLM